MCFHVNLSSVRERIVLSSVSACLSTPVPSPASFAVVISAHYLLEPFVTGKDTLFPCRVGPGVRVCSCEPLPQMHQLLMAVLRAHILQNTTKIAHQSNNMLLFLQKSSRPGLVWEEKILL